jgi:hypothetical protein
MAQEIQYVDYESMVNKYINEWDGCNLREFCFSKRLTNVNNNHNFIHK